MNPGCLLIFDSLICFWRGRTRATDYSARQHGVIHRSEKVVPFSRVHKLPVFVTAWKDRMGTICVKMIISALARKGLW